MPTLIAGPVSTEISTLQYAILVALKNTGPTHAYGVRTEIARLNKEKPSFDRINTPSIYKGLMALNTKGLVTYEPLKGDEQDEQVPGRPQRRFRFIITDEGRKSLEEAKENMASLIEFSQV